MMSVILANNPFAELASSYPLLTVVALLPAIGAVLIGLLPRGNAAAARGARAARLARHVAGR